MTILPAAAQGGVTTWRTVWTWDDSTRPPASCVCLFAHFDPADAVDPYVLFHLRALRACDIAIVFISACAALPDPEIDKLRGVADAVVLRENRGLDFASWQQAMRLGLADGFSHVLLANDSVYGPLRPIAPALRGALAGGADAWGMVESRDGAWHLQSWFVLLRAELLRRPPLRTLFALPFADMAKDDIIARGEIGLGHALQEAGARCEAASRALKLPFLQRRRPLNRMHVDWRALVLSGLVPFLKIELLRDNPIGVPGVSRWPRLLEGGDYPASLIRDHLARVPPKPARMRLSWRGRMYCRLMAVAACSDPGRLLAWGLAG